MNEKKRLILLSIIFSVVVIVFFSFLFIDSVKIFSKKNNYYIEKDSITNYYLNKDSNNKQDFIDNANILISDFDERELESLDSLKEVFSEFQSKYLELHEEWFLLRDNFLKKDSVLSGEQEKNVMDVEKRLISAKECRKKNSVIQDKRVENNFLKIRFFTAYLKDAKFFEEKINSLKKKIELIEEKN